MNKMIEDQIENGPYLKWDQLFMSMVYLVAMKSKDPRTKIGAVIINPKNHAIVSLGYNGLPRGVDDNYPTRYQAPEKYHWFEHGERNAIYNAKRDLTGFAMYTHGTPCSDCARAVIQSEIKEVVVHWQWENKASHKNKWIESAERSKQMFKEAGVTLRFFKGDVITELVGRSDGIKYPTRELNTAGLV